MKWNWIVSLLVLAGVARAGVPGYIRMPTIHGDQIVFMAEADLWKVSTAGGLAMRLTSHPASETSPYFSPDGKTIAFTAAYEGNTDVYVMSSDGGEPKRLTFHPTAEDCCGWTPDGKYILFTSRRHGLDTKGSLYQVPVAGGPPSTVKVGIAENASFSSDGKMVAFNPFVWNGTWKRYRGGTAPKIWVGDLSANKFWRMTNDQAVDQDPMWIGDRVYFVSERTFPANIWSCKPDGSDAKQVTQHKDYDVRFANSDGRRIVYTVAAELWVLETGSGQTKKIETSLASDRIRERWHTQDAAKTLENYDLSDDGKRVVISSRGEIWNAPAKPGGRIIQVTPNDSAIRQRQAIFSPDGKKIICITDETGEQELSVYDSAGKEPHKLLTKINKGWLFTPTWSADSKWIAFGDMTGVLQLADAETGALKEVDSNKNWEITEYTFSPDGKWLAYSKWSENYVNTIWLYEIATATTTCVSGGFASDYSPAWDPKGKYLYFLSNRVIRPIRDDIDQSFLVTRSSKPCVLILTKDGKSPFLPEEMLEDDKDKKDEKKEDKKDAATQASTQASASQPATTQSAEDKKKELPKVVIDLDGIERRVVEFPVERGNCGMLGAIEGKIFWHVRPTQSMGEESHGGGDGGGDLQVYDFKKRKSETFISGMNAGYTLSRDGKKIAWRKGGEILVAETGSKPGGEIEEKVSLSALPLQVTPSDEWKQIYAEAWRLQRDFYWAENMVGLDWAAMRKRYEPLLERVATRGELNDLIGQLIGELGTSHTYVFGGDSTYQPPNPIPVGTLGADIELDAKTGLHQFVRILRGDLWETDEYSPLTQTHANVQEGDYLLAVNGRPLKPTDNADAQFVGLAGVQVQLTVCSKPDTSDARDIQIKTRSGDDKLRYVDWCRRNREYVEAKSGGKIGYSHIPDMGTDGLIRFIEGFYPQTQKDALIIDDRGNHGGNISQMLIEKLDRKLWAFQKPRRGMNSSYPERVHIGYKCVLIDEHAGSDGDIFPDSFRTHGLGPLIGKRTWGGVVGIRMDKRFIDAGVSSQPEFAWWDPKRGWSIENHGVDPDIEVEYRPDDYIAGNDPQLDRGIEEMLKKMKEKPVERPQPPPLPVRAPK